MFVDVLKVLVSSGEDTDQSDLSLIRLSSYLSTSTEGSDQPPAISPVPEGATAVPKPKPKESEFGFPDIPFNEPDEVVVLESSGPPAKPILKPIEGTLFSYNAWKIISMELNIASHSSFT